MLRLITIPFSHYNEKARWALAHFRVPYWEDAYLPGLHVLPVAWATRRRADAAADRQSSRFSTPVLLTDTGRRICDSGRILRWLDARHADVWTTLFPNEASGDLERQYGTVLGPATRRLVYSWIIDREDVMRELALRNVPPLQARLHLLTWPLLRERMRAGFCLDSRAALERAEHDVMQTLVEAAVRLGGSPYLADTRFSAADLAFATLLAPVLGVTREDGFGAWLPHSARFPRAAREFVRHVRKSPGGAHALAMFDRHRLNREPNPGSPVRTKARVHRLTDLPADAKSGCSGIDA